jgi:ATP-dependent RNA helicase SUPV3L1/SUV3
VELCAGLVAEAFALPPAAAAAFGRRALEAERRRRAERAAAAKLARETRAIEEQRLEAWEASLVPSDAVSSLLGCSREEAERWVATGLVPVARRVVRRRAGRTVRESEFDPRVLKELRVEVRPGAAPTDASPRRGSSRSRTEVGEKATPPLPGLLAWTATPPISSPRGR